VQQLRYCEVRDTISGAVKCCCVQIMSMPTAPTGPLVCQLLASPVVAQAVAQGCLRSNFVAQISAILWLCTVMAAEQGAR
jgi:hypothetical protein